MKSRAYLLLQHNLAEADWYNNYNSCILFHCVMYPNFLVYFSNIGPLGGFQFLINNAERDTNAQFFFLLNYSLRIHFSAQKTQSTYMIIIIVLNPQKGVL